ncbi:unnamed protein product [Ophioblennius macclurei]
MASCLVPDFPAVQVALEHLRELDRDLAAADGTRTRFGPEAGTHLAQIAGAVSELEAERRAAREQLEVASIENSELRHRLHTLGHTMGEELKAQVAAALTSVTVEMEELRGDLSAAARLEEDTADKRRHLLEKNEALRPQTEALEAELQARQAALNEDAALKLRLQEHLDLTRDRTQQMASDTAALQQDLLALQEDAALERDAFATARDEVTREEELMEEEVQQQKHAVRGRSRELDAARKKKDEACRRLERLAGRAAALEGGLQTLTASQRRCEERREEEAQKRRDLLRRGELLEAEPGQVEEESQLAVCRLQQEVEAVEQEIEEARAAGRRLREKLRAAGEVDRRRQAEESRVGEEHSLLSQQLQRSKRLLEERRAAAVRYRQEAREMEQHIRELRDANAAAETAFQKNWEELRGQVITESEKVAQMEEEEARLRSLLERSRRKQEEHQAEVESRIGATRRRREELRREEAELRQRAPEDADADLLRSLVAQMERKRKEAEEAHREEMEKLAAEAEVVLRSNQEKRRAAEEKEEVLKEAEQKHEEAQRRREGAEALHRELLALRTRLAASVEEQTAARSSLLLQREELKAQLVEAQERHLHLLDRHASELCAVEAHIYNGGVRLERVHLENSRLQLAIATMEEEAGRARRDHRRHLQETQRLLGATQEQREALREAWKEEALLTRRHQSDHAHLLDAFGVLMEQLETRRRRVGGVGSLLNAHLMDFSRRLGGRGLPGRRSNECDSV